MRIIAVGFVVALSLAGCSKAVQITAPTTAGPTSAALTGPLTAFSVKFSPFVVPASFNAQFDGADVTKGFVPAATPGGTSTMKVSDAWEGLTGGTIVNGSGPPPRPLPVGTLPSDIKFTPAVVPSLPAGVPSGGAGGKPMPNIAVFTHQLDVAAQCNGVICATTDQLVFVPIHLAGNPTALDLRLGQKAQATVETFPAASAPITVRLRPFNVAVSLDGQAPGSPIFRTIPPGGASAPFTITAVVASNLIVIIEAPGTQMGSIQGAINQ